MIGQRFFYLVLLCFFESLHQQNHFKKKNSNRLSFLVSLLNLASMTSVYRLQTSQMLSYAVSKIYKITQLETKNALEENQSHEGHAASKNTSNRGPSLPTIKRIGRQETTIGTTCYHHKNGSIAA